MTIKFFEPEENNVVGFFLLKDKTASEETVWEQEIGVCLNNDLYIPKDYKCKEPQNLYHLFLLQENSWKIEQAFEKLSIKLKVPKDVFALKNPSNLKPRLSIAIKRIDEKEHQEITPYFFDGENIIIFSNGEIFTRQGKNYERQSRRIIACTSQAMLFMVNNLLFWQEDNTPPVLVGHSYQRVHDDLIFVDGHIYQITEKGLEKKTFDRGEFVKAQYINNRLHLHWSYTFRSADYISQYYIYLYKKENGRWVEDGCRCLEDIAENLY